MQNRLAVYLLGLWLILSVGTVDVTYAQDDVQETFIADFIVSCSSTGQLCDPPFFVSVETGSLLQVQYTARSTHCSSIAVHISADGGAGFSSGFLAAGQSTGLVNLGPVSAGVHVISVQAEGRQEGCNTGRLGSWGGSLRIFTSVIPEDICTDDDGDGYFAHDSQSCPQGNDCNDNDPAINPGATESCDGIDNNCNGEVDEGACNDMCPVSYFSSLNVASGNLSHSQQLFSTRGSHLTTNFVLNYNSLDPYLGPLGRGWVHSYDIALTEMVDGSVVFREGNGQRRLYHSLSGGGYLSQPGDYSSLTKEASGWNLVEKGGVTYGFDPQGKVTSLADRNGNAITFSYNNGLLLAITDPGGRTTAFNYDASNRITTVTDPNGNIHLFTYSNDTLTSVSTQDALLGVRSWSYTYDAGGFMLTKTDPAGNTTTYVYDSDGRVVRATNQEGEVKTSTYNPLTTTTQLTETDGGVWTYVYDSLLGVLVQNVDPQGNTTVYAYDQNKNLTSKIDPDGGTTSFTFDSQGNMTSLTDPLGQTTTYTHNSFGQITSLTDPQGDTTSQSYDSRGNLTSITDPGGATTSFEYDAKGNVTKITDALGRTSTLTYDSRNNLASITDPTGTTITFAYDISGNLTSQTDAQGNTTRFEYNSLNQLLKLIDPSGNATIYAYDQNGNPVSRIDANGNRTEYEYNSKGQLTAVKDALGNLTTYAYGHSGCPSCGGGGDSQLTSITDAKGQTTLFQYDPSGRLLGEVDPLGNAISYAYDSNGRLTSKTDANGATVQYAYDALGRLLTKTYPDSTSDIFTYDTRGNVLTATNQNISYTFSYDGNGRVTSIVDSNNRTIDYQYDALGNRTGMTYPDGTVVTYGYDNAGRLLSLTHDGRTFAYEYDSLGRRTRYALPNGTAATYAYDSNGRLTNLAHRRSDASVIQSFAYTYDKVGNRKTKVDRNGAFSYTYDALYHLTEAINPLPHNPLENYTYDAVGNRTDSNQNGPSIFDSGNQLTEDANFTYQYDSNGNLTTKAAKIGSEISLYEYDAENRLIRVEIQRGDKAKIVSFTYDPFGRRLSKTVQKQEFEDEEGEAEDTDEDDREVPRTAFYIYDNEDIILEYNHKGKIRARYTHGLGIDEPLAIERKGKIYFYHTDGLGSVVALTDSTQKIVQSYDYDSFGNFKRMGNKTKQPYAFTGREWDKETRLYYYRARFYDPSTGRFLQEDPILHAGNQVFPYLLPFLVSNPQLLNPYVYVTNDPGNSVDPFGLAEDSVSAAIRQAAARGDVAELETILEATGNQAARAAIDRLKSQAADIIAKECKGSINRVFPGELRNKTLEEIIRRANQGDPIARTAKKLLTDLRFKK